MTRFAITLLLAASFAAGAQAPASVAPPALPIAAEPAPDYRDADPAAIAQSVPERDDPRADRRVLAQLDHAVAKQPEHLGLLVARAHQHAIVGNADASEAGFARAMIKAGSDPELKRHVSWSWGWARLVLDEPREALAHWRDAERLHGGRPHWVPHTYATALWRLGERELALAYFDVAVRSFPDKWATRADLKRHTAHWRERHRRLLDEVWLEWKSRRATK